MIYEEENSYLWHRIIERKTKKTSFNSVIFYFNILVCNTMLKYCLYGLRLLFQICFPCYNLLSNYLSPIFQTGGVMLWASIWAKNEYFFVLDLWSKMNHRGIFKEILSSLCVKPQKIKCSLGDF